jgi:hypothetical protein
MFGFKWPWTRAEDFEENKRSQVISDIEEYFHYKLVDEYYRSYADILVVNEHKIKILFNRLSWFDIDKKSLNHEDFIIIDAIKERIVELLDYAVEILGKSSFYSINIIKKHLAADKREEALSVYQDVLTQELGVNRGSDNYDAYKIK